MGGGAELQKYVDILVPSVAKSSTGKDRSTWLAAIVSTTTASKMKVMKKVRTKRKATPRTKTWRLRKKLLSRRLHLLRTMLRKPRQRRKVLLRRLVQPRKLPRRPRKRKLLPRKILRSARLARKPRVPRRRPRANIFYILCK